MQGEVLEAVDQTAVPAYDRLEEEPNLDILFSVRRDDSSPQAGSHYKVSVLREGKAEDLSKGQMQYVASLMRYFGDYLRGHTKKSVLDKKTGFDLTIDEAKLARNLVLFAMADWISYVHAAVENQGIENTARVLRIPPAAVEFYLTFQPYLPRKTDFDLPRLFPLERLERYATIGRRLTPKLPGAFESKTLQRAKRKIAKKRVVA